jgi:hypothetical protein
MGIKSVTHPQQNRNENQCGDQFFQEVPGPFAQGDTSMWISA